MCGQEPPPPYMFECIMLHITFHTYTYLTTLHRMGDGWRLINWHTPIKMLASLFSPFTVFDVSQRHYALVLLWIPPESRKHFYLVLGFNQWLQTVCIWSTARHLRLYSKLSSRMLQAEGKGIRSLTLTLSCFVQLQSPEYCFSMIKKYVLVFGWC